MSNVPLDSYVPILDAIISVSDPDKVSPKKIRRALEQLFSVSLEPQKREINELIVSRFQMLQNDPHILVSREEFSNLKKIQNNYDALLSSDSHIKKQKEKAKAKTKVDVKKKKKAKTTKAVTKPRTENPGSKSINSLKLRLSDELSDFLGQTELPRTQVVKLVWDYIKKHDLQSPSDRREIICDDRMRPIFGDKVTMFSLNKVLSQHLHKIDPVEVSPIGLSLEADIMNDFKQENGMLPLF
ncbi:Protein TRI1 [Nakaseomyces bracarensis]|uniref:Protein TRI1 n=1 Tax=Nakaseomyces bracarensis TaxID=273131 RepID=A0ABR4NRQ3_9SACH